MNKKTIFGVPLLADDMAINNPAMKNPTVNNWELNRIKQISAGLQLKTTFVDAKEIPPIRPLRSLC